MAHAAGKLEVKRLSKPDEARTLDHGEFAEVHRTGTIDRYAKPDR